MWDSYPGGYQGYQNDILLATGGHDYGPQFGPAVPRDYYNEDGECPCDFGREDECELHYQWPIEEDPSRFIPEHLVR